MTRIAALFLGLIALAPVVALVPSSLFDLGPETQVRFSLFPLALALYDPLIWTSLANSLTVASVVALGSLLLGIGLGQIISRWNVWSRPLVVGLTLAPAVISPTFLTLGLVGLFEATGPRFASPILDSFDRSAGFPGQTWSWVVWIWAAMIQGSALVACTMSISMHRLNPDWEVAARLAGAGAFRAWRSVTWPMLRPSVLSTTRLIFVITLCDPGPALILALRRTLGFQIVATAMSRDPFPRIAALALMAIAISLIGRMVIRPWTRTSLDSSVSLDVRQREPDGKLNHRVGVRGVASLGLILVGSSLFWLPWIGLTRTVMAATVGLPDDSSVARRGMSDLVKDLVAGPASGLMVRSLLLGLAVVLVALVLNRVLVRTSGGRQVQRWRQRVRSLGELVPPLIVGVGILALSRSAELAGRFAATGLGWGEVSQVLELGCEVARSRSRSWHFPAAGG